MSDRLKSVLAVVASVLLAGGLLWLSLRGADVRAVATTLRGASWGWLVPMAVLLVGSVVLRAWRWRVLLNALPGGPPPPLPVVTGATFVGYLVNYAAPRAGEMVRAANVSARSPLPFPAVVGTVVAERVLDVFSLAVALLVVAVLYGGRLGFLAAGVTEATAAAQAHVWVLLGAGVLVVLLGILFVWAVRRSAGRLARLVAGFRDGLLAVARSGHPVALVGSTVALWGCYAILADLPLRLLGMSARYGLSVVDAFAVMAAGAVGMSLPSPGGTGSYHYATVQALTQLFGVGASDAATYALLAHAAQLIVFALAGGTALVVQGTSLRAARVIADDEPSATPGTPRRGRHVR